MTTETTLSEAQALVRSHWEDPHGIACPCCGQKVYIYKRKLTGSMARALIALWQHEETIPFGEYTHIERLIKLQPRLSTAVRSNCTLPKHWGLLDQQPGVREDGSSRTGYFRLSSLGREFVTGGARVHLRACLFNNKLIGMTGPQVTIQEVIGTKFDYEELMSA